MGYSIGDVSSEAIEDALLKKTVIIPGIVLIKPSVGTTEETMYKKTMDLTNIDYLDFILDVRCTGATTGTVKLKVGGVIKATVVNSAGGDTGDWALTQIDCTSITGDNVILITGDNSAAGGYTWAVDVTLLSREAP